MAGLTEDDLEEAEFRSMKPFKQQRYLKMIHQLDDCFRDIQSKLKNNRVFLDIDDNYEPYKEQLDDYIEHWNYKITSWESRHSDQKTLVLSLKKELEKHTNNFNENYNALAENETTITQKIEDKGENNNLLEF